jgi:hypothetical protein
MLIPVVLEKLEHHLTRTGQCRDQLDWIHNVNELLLQRCDLEWLDVHRWSHNSGRQFEIRLAFVTTRNHLGEHILASLLSFHSRINFTLLAFLCGGLFGH